MRMLVLTICAAVLVIGFIAYMRYVRDGVAEVAHEAEVFDRIFQLIRDFERQFRDQGDMDLSTTQFQALMILAEAQPVTAMAMAGMLRIAGPTATRALDSLERRRLIIKERDPQDRRIVWLRLTDRGEEILQSEQQRQRGWISKLMDGLTPEDQHALLTLMQKLTQQGASIS